MTPVSDNDTRLIVSTQLVKARELVGLKPEDVAREIGVSPTDVLTWERGSSEPALGVLEALARLYGREIDFFLRETPSPPREIKFRGKPGASLEHLSKETRLVLGRFDELCRMAFEFEGLLNVARQVNLNTLAQNLPARKAAEQVRALCKLGDNPISDLRGALETAGARIFEIPVPNDELSGFSFWHPQYGPCILVNAKDSKGRRNFTLAHELGHLLYDHGTCACYIPMMISDVHHTVERKANQFAAEFLLPEIPVVKDFHHRNLGRSPSETQLASMAARWMVSVQALGYRLEKLQLVKAGVTDKIVESRPTFFRRPKVPPWERRLGKRYVDTTLSAYRSNLISASKLAHALQIPIRKALEKIETAGR